MFIKVNLDTNAFNNKALLVLLRTLVDKKELKIIMSPIVLLEYGFYQELRRKRQQFLQLLNILQIEIEPVKKNDAILAIKHSIMYKDDEKGPQYYFRDALIAALSERLEIPVLTNNTNNFKGLPATLKKNPEEFIKQYDKNF